jgi:RluA family pseudouridine synthase
MMESRKLKPEEDLYLETGYRILHSENAFLVIEKPAPLPVHPVGRFRKRNLLSLLKKDFGSEGASLRIVNRLDSETSGIVLVSRLPEMAGPLGLLFERRRIRKEYHAVVLGAPAKDHGTIDVPLGLRPGGVHNIRVPDPDGQEARTDYEVLSRAGDYSLLKLVPHTGRTHQIRVHLAHLGHPVAGDKIYIDPAVFERYIHEGWQEDMRSVVKAERLLLHASGLEFIHPVTEEKLKFRSALPECFSEFLAAGDRPEEKKERER